MEKGEVELHLIVNKIVKFYRKMSYQLVVRKILIFIAIFYIIILLNVNDLYAMHHKLSMLSLKVRK